MGVQILRHVCQLLCKSWGVILVWVICELMILQLLVGQVKCEVLTPSSLVWPHHRWFLHGFAIGAFVWCSCATFSWPAIPSWNLSWNSGICRRMGSKWQARHDGNSIGGMPVSRSCGPFLQPLQWFDGCWSANFPAEHSQPYLETCPTIGSTKWRGGQQLDRANETCKVDQGYNSPNGRFGWWLADRCISVWPICTELGSFEKQTCVATWNEWRPFGPAESCYVHADS